MNLEISNFRGKVRCTMFLTDWQDENEYSLLSEVHVGKYRLHSEHYIVISYL